MRKEELFEEFFSSTDDEELYCGFCIQSELLCGIITEYEDDFDSDLWQFDTERSLIVFKLTDDGYLGISNDVRHFVTDTLFSYVEDSSGDCADEISERLDSVCSSISIIYAIENDLINGTNGDNISNYIDELKKEYDSNSDVQEEYDSFESYYNSLSFIWRRKTWYYNKKDHVDELEISIDAY